MQGWGWKSLGGGPRDGLQETVDRPGSEQTPCSGRGGLEELTLIDCHYCSGQEVIKSSDGVLVSGTTMGERGRLSSE